MQFNLKGTACLVIGPRSKKTTILSNLMFQNRDIPAGLVMSSNKATRQLYENTVPTGFTFDGFSEEAITRLMKRQEKLGHANIDARAFLIVDDSLSKIASTELEKLFLQARYRNVSVVLSLEYDQNLSIDLRNATLSPALRVNADLVFCLKDDCIENKKRLYREFFQPYIDLDTFIQTMDATEDGVLVLDRRKSVVKVFSWKPEPIPQFRMGSEPFWSYGNLTGAS